MRKNSIAIISLAFLASCFMVSCSTEAFDTNQPVKGAKIVIPAQKMSTKAVDAAGKATFKTSEVVYICKGTTIDAGELYPAKNGPSADITGTLQNTGYSVNDQISVLYNTNASGVVDYSGQDGSIESVRDAGWASATIDSYSSGGVFTTTPANIENLQSIFKFTFYNGSISAGNEISGIRFVRVFSTNNKLVSSYNAISKSSTPGPVTISRSTNLDDNYIYAALRFDSYDGDEIVFQVIDENGKVYSGSKSAPEGGFEIGKFYESTVTVNLYTFTVSSGKQVCFSPGDLGVNNGVYSFTEPFVPWGWGDKNATTRVWFNYSEVTAPTVYGIQWRIENYVSSAYEWNNIINRKFGEDPSYYKVTLPGHSNCLLLLPDETILTEAEKTELKNGTLGADYVKYFGKGFVLLISTGYANALKSTWSWGNSTEGWYWSYRNTSNRYYFKWTSSGNPIAEFFSNQARMRARLIHNVN